MAAFDANDPGAVRKLREVFGPGQPDQLVRQAIQVCWMMLPEGRQTADELEAQFRRVAERALKDFREDAAQFGLGIGRE